MIESVTYTGFETHPERKAWVEETTMPFVVGVLRREPEPLRVYWHDPNLWAATPDELLRIVRQTVVPGLGASPLVGRIHGREPGHWDDLIYPGVILVICSERISSGWTYLPVPNGDRDNGPLWWHWSIRSVYLAMLSDATDRRQRSYEDEPVLVGGGNADSI
jgi:hypothetical protein